MLFASMLGSVSRGQGEGSQADPEAAQASVQLGSVSLISASRSTCWACNWSIVFPSCCCRHRACPNTAARCEALRRLARQQKSMQSDAQEAHGASLPAKTTQAPSITVHSDKMRMLLHQTRNLYSAADALCRQCSQPPLVLPVAATPALFLLHRPRRHALPVQ